MVLVPQPARPGNALYSYGLWYLFPSQPDLAMPCTAVGCGTCSPANQTWQCPVQLWAVVLVPQPARPGNALYSCGLWYLFPSQPDLAMPCTAVGCGTCSPSSQTWQCLVQLWAVVLVPQPARPGNALYSCGLWYLFPSQPDCAKVFYPTLSFTPVRNHNSRQLRPP